MAEEEEMLRGALPQIVMIEKISKWKRYVTEVRGLFHFDIDEFGLADRLKRALGCSADAFDSKDGSQLAVIVQGRKGKTIHDILVRDFKVPLRQLVIKA